MKKPEQNQGVALLLSLGVLAVLAILSITFVKLTVTERKSGKNYALMVKANLCAQAGISQAIAQLQVTVAATPYTDISKDTWLFRTKDGSDLGYYPKTTLDNTKYPSMAFDADGDGTFENGEGGTSTDDLIHGRAVSGVIEAVGAGTKSSTSIAKAEDVSYTNNIHEHNSSVYILRIRDTSSKINVNGKQANLAVILDELGKAISAEELIDPIKILGGGAAIVSYRDKLPGGRLNDIESLQSIFPTPTKSSDPKWRDYLPYLEAYLTWHSWLDPTTVKPSPAKDPATLPKTATEPRYPVNMNTAPKPVLRALISGLEGYEFQFVEGSEVHVGAATVIDEKKLTTAITFAQAGTIADEIIKARATTPFRTWDQFKQFALGLKSVATISPKLTDGQLDVLRANFNPNTLTARFNPQRVRAHRVSKWDLTRHSIEFCFGGNGFFDITSIGLITQFGGKVQARATHRTIVQVTDMIRHTTQVDFEGHRIANTRTVTYPESVVDLKSTGSLVDGQLEMFSPPPSKVTFTHTTYCFRITANIAGFEQNPSNHLVVGHIPDASARATALASVTNNRGFSVVELKTPDPHYGIQGFKFSPGVIGGNGKPLLDSLEFCFTVPKGTLTHIKIGTQKASKYGSTSFPVSPPDFTPRTDQNGFKIEMLSAFDQDKDGETGSTTKGALFYSPFHDELDARFGGDTKWKADKNTPIKSEGKSVFLGSSLLPDGMLSSRSLAQELSYKSTTNINLLTGTVEFWIKLVGDGTEGSNEAPLYMISPVKSPKEQPFEGIINKLLRFGGTLYNTRAYVGHPDGATSPYTYSFAERSVDISKWKDHEWHHIAIAWTGGVEHEFYVDGKRATSYLTYKSSDIKFRLASNDPADHFPIGGYEFYSPTGASIFSKGTVIVKGQNERFSNSTIAEFKSYPNNGVFTKTGFTPPDRFIANPLKPSVWHGKFEFRLPYAVKIGSVSWTEYQPKAWHTSTFNATPSSLDTDVEVKIKVEGSSFIGPFTSEAAGGDGRGMKIDKTLAAWKGGTDPARTVEYEMTFKGSLVPLNVTSSIDDITIVFQIPPKIVYWKRD